MKESCDRWIPDNIVDTWWNKITKTSKMAFFSALVIGFLCHFAGINKWGLFNWDQRFNKDVISQLWLSQGKWLGGSVSYLLCDEYSSLSYSTAIGLVCIAVLAAILVKTFSIKSTVIAAGIGGVLATFLSVMQIIVYNVEIYFAVALICVLSVAVTCFYQGRCGWLVGTVLLTLALGIYPAYISFAACALLLLIAMEVFREGSTFLSIVKTALKAFFHLLCALLLYGITLQIVLTVKDTELSNYYNMDQAGHILINKIPEYIVQIYQNVLGFFWNDIFGTKDLYIIFSYRLFLFLMVISIIYTVIYRKIYKKIYKLAILSGILLLYPIAVDLASLIGNGVSTHWLMKYTYVMVPIAALVVTDWCLQSAFAVDELPGKNKVLIILQQWVTFALCIAMVHGNCLVTNQGYLRMRLAFEKNYAILLNVVDDMYESEVYKPGLPVAFIVDTPPFNDDGMNQFNNLTGIQNNYLFAYEGVLERFETMFVGITFRYVSEETKKAIEATPEFAQMPSYPKKGYISEINGVVTAKF